MAIDCTLAVASVTYSTRTNTTVTKPSGVVEGDDMIAVHYIESAATVTAPSGWVAISDRVDLGSSCYLTVYHKRAGASEPADYTWTHSSSATQAAIKRVTGCSTTIEDCAESVATGYDTAASSITTVTDGAALFMVAVAIGGATFSGWSSPLVEYYDGGQFAIAMGIQDTAGPSGAKSTSSGVESSALLFALRPAPSGTVNQHSFRFFNDDGSESGSTVKADLNTNINLSASGVARIRFLIDATGDPAGAQYQLEYRRKPSGGEFSSYKKVN